MSHAPSTPVPTVLIGAGGHAAAVLEVIRAAGLPDPVGCLDRAATAPVLGVPVIGDEARLEALREQGVVAAVVCIGHNATRLRLIEQALLLGYALPVLAHPAAILSPSARLGAGSVVLPRVVLGARAKVGEGAILNTGAIVEHDCALGRAVHVAPGAVIGGGVQVGDGVLVGIGAALRPLVRVGAGAVIGLGAAVAADVPEGATVGGVPARVLG